MTRQELEAVRKHNAAIVQDICAQYGMYGNVIFYEPSPIPESSLNRMYIVAGLDPVLGQDKFPRNLRPDEMLQAIKRNEKLFYPRAWVLDLKETKNEIVATEKLAEYCEKASGIAGLYGEYGLPAPKTLRVSEVYQLMNFRDGLDNPHATREMKQKYRKDLNWFFRREMTQSKFRRNWLNYFRSEKFPDDKGPFAKLRGFFRKEECEISLKKLLDSHAEVSKMEMQEFEYRIFRKLIQERYPFVSYAAGDKEVVDHGINKATRRDDSPFGKCVTAEEYAVIRKERFAQEGWDCVANLRQAYWEFRDVYFKDCDKPLIASVYQHIVLQYAKCDSLSDLKKLGPMHLQQVPLNDFMNFVSLAKSHKLRFYIDTLGDFETPSLETVNVLYSDCQQHKLDSIMERMVTDKVNYSHVLQQQRRPTLNTKIHTIEEHNYSNRSCRTPKEYPHQK